jgi:hypothetical protein
LQIHRIDLVVACWWDGQLRQQVEARSWLRISFDMAKIRKIKALHEKDLEPLWNEKTASRI